MHFVTSCTGGPSSCIALYLKYNILMSCFFSICVSPPWTWQGVSATLQSGRYTLLYQRGRYVGLRGNIFLTPSLPYMTEISVVIRHVT